MKKELIFGIHAVQTAIKQDPDNVISVLLDRKRQDKRVKPIRDLAQQFNIRIEEVDGRTLDQKAGRDNQHQGVAAYYQPAEALNENDLFVLLEKQDDPFLLILDGVTDPHNLGACLRTADAVGATAVVVPKDKAVGLTPTVRKVACGAAETVAFIQVTNLARCLEQLKEQGVWLMGTSDQATASLYQTDLKGPLGLIMGAEGKGMRSLTEKHCDVLLSIPMLGNVESLNVSVATAVCLYEALRQRQYAS